MLCSNPFPPSFCYGISVPEWTEREGNIWLLISLAWPFIIHKPPRLDFDTMLSSIATLSQSPLPSCPHSWLPCTNPFYFTLASFLSPSSPLPFSILQHPHLPSPSLPLLLYMSMICPYSCYIGLYSTISSYTGFATRDDAYDVIIIDVYTAAMHDAIISVELLGGSRLKPTLSRLGTRVRNTLATHFRYRCSAMLTLKTKKTAMTLSHVHSNIRQI